MQETIEQLPKSEKPTLLLHCCCAPCSTAVLKLLSESFKITAFFYNPNIYPFYEYEKRLFELKKLVDTHHVDIDIIAPEYDSEPFYHAVLGFEDCPERGERCDICVEMRLFKTAEFARQNGFQYFCSTLSISPHKNCEFINQQGINLEQQFGVFWLCNDFKKGDGFRLSTQLSKQYNLYRQNYCGCEFSIRNEDIND